MNELKCEAQKQERKRNNRGNLLGKFIQFPAQTS